MRVLIDTNILISSILGHGTPFQAYVKAVSSPNHGVICTQNIDELRRIFNRKFPKKINAMERFLSLALQSLELVQIPEAEVSQEERIRDVNDRPIMRAAVFANVDVVLTGDKDFLESGIMQPKIMTATEFLMK
jgi:putative PIN family toxin of toxin-antitoxin system